MGEDKLQNLDKLELKDLREEYRNDLNEFVDIISKILGPKEINGKKMNGELFCEYLKLIVDAINSNKTIYLHETVGLALKSIAEHNLKDCLDKFDSHLKPITCNFPTKTSILNEKLNKVKELILKEFKTSFNNDGQTVTYEEFKKKLNDKMDEKIKLIKDDNKSKIRVKDINSAFEIWKSKFNSVKVEDRFASIDDFNEEIQKFKKQFISFDDTNETAHLNEQFWSEIFNHPTVNVTNLKERIIKGQEKRNKQELERAREQMRRDRLEEMRLEREERMEERRMLRE